ncbi:MAG: hypothetical protein AB7O59_23870 [Pirellulales bacterium]
MMRTISAYFTRLTEGFGRGWTEFWFTPSDPAMSGLIRLLTGLVVLYLHATLSFDLVAFFGPDGLLPAADIRPLEGGTLSYLNYVSQPAELWTVHLLGLAVLVAFTLGLWTPWTCVLALVVFLSDIHRAAMLTSLTEPIAAMVMLYLCFAPCGRTYSLGAWWGRRAKPAALTAAPANEQSTLATIATRLIQVHLALLVATMAFSQLAGDVWWLGTAMWWLMARPESRLVDLTPLARSPMAINAWTHLIVLAELAFAILVWVPLARPLVMAAAALAWISLALVTGEVTFALMMGIASLAFVSPELLPACCRGKATVAVPTA